MIALMNVAKGIAKKRPQKPQIPPKNNTDITIITGCKLFLAENKRGTSKFPSSA